MRRGLAYTSKADESALFCRQLPEGKPDISFCMPLPAQCETPAELMKKADQALYQAKENGRDRVVVAEPNNGMSGVSPIKLRQ